MKVNYKSMFESKKDWAFVLIPTIVVGNDHDGFQIGMSWLNLILVITL